MSKIGVPTVSGMKGAFTNAAIGAGGGLVYSLAQSIFGNGLFGAIAATVLAGSVVKGSAGEALATIAGFNLLTSGGVVGSSGETSGAAEETM